MNNSIESYNKSYAKFTPDFLENTERLHDYLTENNKSLINFFNRYYEQFPENDLSRLSLLELGSGMGGLPTLIGDRFDSYLGIDFSDIAVSIAKKVYPRGEFKVFDVLSNKKLSNPFDILFDSHLFHCLSFKDDRLKYYSFLKSHMHEKSRIFIETMVFHKKIKIPASYLFEDGVLYQETDDFKYSPFRSLLTVSEIESELKACGFHIDYLYYHSELTINPYEDKLPVDQLPHVLRLSAMLR